MVSLVSMAATDHQPYGHALVMSVSRAMQNVDGISVDPERVARRESGLPFALRTQKSPGRYWIGEELIPNCCMTFLYNLPIFNRKKAKQHGVCKRQRPEEQSQ